MGNENVTVVVTNQQHKSDAPWILGIIGFIVSIPTACAAAGVAAIEAARQDAVNSGNTAAEASATNSGEAFAWMLLVFAIISLLCFILSFFGKSKISVVTGILLILGALFILVNGFVGFGNMLLGSIVGICYLIGGIFSIINRKRLTFDRYQHTCASEQA